MMNRRTFLKNTGRSFLALSAGAGFQGCRREKLPQSSATPRSGKTPNIVWIIMDDCRADAVGCYGQPWVKTPHMDALAASGIRFESAIVQNPVCVPSRRSMKTGRYAYEIGPVGMGRPPAQRGRYINADQMQRLDQSPTLLDRFAQAGIYPVNVGKIHGFERSWDNRGDAPVLFDVAGISTSYSKQLFGYRLSEILDVPRVFTPTHKWQIGGVLDIKPEDTETWRLGDMAVETLEQLSAEEAPFFLRVSFRAPHVACYVPKAYFIDPATIKLPLPTQEQLDSKPRFEREQLRIYAGGLELAQDQINLARGTYYGMVSLVDVQVGRLVAKLKEKGLLDNTLIALNSDQGFQLGEHGMWKKRMFYEQNVRVPMILSCPSLLPSGKVIDEPIEMVDFLPTLMDLTGVDVPSGSRGRSLMPLIEGKVKTWRRRKACFCEIDHSQSMYDELRQGTGRRVMVRTKAWKLIFFMDDRVVDKDGALYDLKNDPGETINHYRDPACSGVIKELEQMAKEWDQGNNLF